MASGLRRWSGNYLCPALRAVLKRQFVSNYPVTNSAIPHYLVSMLNPKIACTVIGFCPLSAGRKRHPSNASIIFVLTFPPLETIGRFTTPPRIAIPATSVLPPPLPAPPCPGLLLMPLLLARFAPNPIPVSVAPQPSPTFPLPGPAPAPVPAPLPLPPNP